MNSAMADSNGTSKQTSQPSVFQDLKPLESLFQEKLIIKQRIQEKIKELTAVVQNESGDNSLLESSTLSIRYGLLESFTYERVKLLQKISLLESQLTKLYSEAGKR